MNTLGLPKKWQEFEKCGLRHTNKGVIGSWKSRLQGNTLSTPLCSMSVKLVFYFPNIRKDVCNYCQVVSPISLFSFFPVEEGKSLWSRLCPIHLDVQLCVALDNWHLTKAETYTESWWNLLTKKNQIKNSAMIKYLVPFLSYLGIRAKVDQGIRISVLHAAKAPIRLSCWEWDWSYITLSLQGITPANGKATFLFKVFVRLLQPDCPAKIHIC